MNKNTIESEQYGLIVLTILEFEDRNEAFVPDKFYGRNVRFHHTEINNDNYNLMVKYFSLKLVETIEIEGSKAGTHFVYEIGKKANE